MSMQNLGSGSWHLDENESTEYEGGGKGAETSSVFSQSHH